MPDGRLYQEVIWRERTFVGHRENRWPGARESALLPRAFDAVPDSWNQAMPQPVIASIEFR